MPNPLQKWRALDRPEQATLLGLSVLLPLIRLGLWVFGFARMQTLLARAGRRAAQSATGDVAESRTGAERLAWLIAVAGRRGPIRATCLPQALALYGLLCRRGLAPDLRFGVRRVGTAVLAHAWVELNGIALANGDQGQTPLQPCH